MKKKIKFNLNFDDLHPQSDNEIQDFGGDREKGVLKELFLLMKEYPKIKIDFFTPADWIYKPVRPFFIRHICRLLGIKNPKYEISKFRLDQHKDWCQWVNKYVDTKNFEICYHGLEHYNPTSRAQSAEFEGISYESAKLKLEKMEKIFKKSGIKHVKGFRPPGWGKSEGLIKAVKERNYDFISLKPSRHRESEVSYIQGIKHVPQNWSIKESSKLGVQIAKESGILLAKGHITNNYGRNPIGNGITKKHIDNVRQVLKKLEKSYEIEFIFLSEL